MATLALLSATGVLLDYRVVDEVPVPLPANAILVPNGCDHEIGCARWDATLRQWSIVAPPTPQEKVEAPDALRALALGFMAIRDGKGLPAETLAWLDAYAKSFDFLG